MTPDKRRELLARVTTALDDLPESAAPMSTFGAMGEFLYLPDMTTDDEALVGFADIIEDLSADLASAVVLLDDAGRERLAEVIAIRRDRGRPPWTKELFWQRYREAIAQTRPPYIDDRVAEHFEKLERNPELPATGEYLGKLIRRFDLPPEFRPE